MGLGISFTTRSSLGTSPISSVPYVLSLIFPLTFGTFTFLLGLCFLLLQILALRSAFPRWQYLQLLVSLCFGCFVDLGMFLTTPIHPGAYAAKFFYLLFGSAILALGIYCQILARGIFNPGEGAVRALAQVFGIRFGNLKVAFDSTLLVTATFLSFCVFHGLRGIREGSIISALLVGTFTNAYAYLARRNNRLRRSLDRLASA